MSYAVTKSRIVQWLGIILILAVFAGAYWYFQVYGSTLNQSQNDLNTNGLVGMWSFNGDDVSGTTAYDRSSTGANGTLTGGPTIIKGKVGQALDFDGTDDYVSVTDNAALDAGDTADLTLSGWFYRDTFTTDDTVIAKRNGIAAGDTGYIAYIDDATDQLIFEVSDGTDEYSLTSSSTFTATGWNHYAIVWDQDSAANSEMYINGMANNATDSGTIGSIGDLGNAIVLATGTESDAGNPFDGKIDEVRVYNRALAAGEIQSLYTAGGGTKSNTSVSQPQGTGRLDSGLAGYWKLDDGSGTSATDSSTNANTGTLTNGPTWTTGQIGNAVDFDGTDDYVTAADADTLDIVDSVNFTLSGWFNRDTFTTDDTILAKSNGQAAADTGYNVYIDDTTDKLTFVANDGTDQYKLESVSTFTATGWHHYSIVWDESGATQTKLYINGISEAATATGTFANVNSLANAVAFRLGAESDNGEPFDGKLDEARLYSRALSADEVAQLYRLATPTSVDTSLKGYWSFNAPDILSSTTAADRSGAGNTGTLTNGPTRTIGKLGQALSFDGSDDYVTVADASSLDITGAHSMSIWIKTTDTSGCIMSKSTATDDKCFDLTANKVYELGILSNTFYYQISNGSTTSLVSGDASGLTNNQWHLLTSTWDGTTGSNGMKVYIDSVLVYQGTSAIASIQSTSSTLNFGGSGVNNDYSGLLDEGRLYNRALSAAEIKGLYDVGAADKTNSAASQAQGTGRLDSGLAGYWKLDDGSGTSATDSSTNANTGTLTSSPTWTTGQIGGAVDFDGTDYITMPDNNAVDMIDGQNFSLSGWFNRDTFTTDDVIVSKRNTLGSSGDTGYGINIDDTTDKLVLDVSDGTDEYELSSTSTFTSTGWNHFSVVWVDSVSAKIYINGAQEETTSTGTFANVNSMASGSTSEIGSDGNGGTNFDGKLDEIRIYNRDLSADEVAQLYRLGTPTGTDTELKGYWSFNGQDMLSSTTAADRSGAGNTGTLTGGPTRTIGKIGQALNFDGTNDYVDTGTRVGPASAYSSCLWAKPRTVSGTKVLFSAYSDSGGVRKLYTQFFINGAGFQGRMIGAYSAGFHYIGRSVASGLVASQWSFLCMTWDGGTTASSIKLYQDGVQVDTTNDSGGTFTTISSDSVHFWIGAQEYESAANNPMNGQLDEVRVYSRALTEAEIKSLYNASR